MHLGLETRTELDQLGPIAHQLARLPHRRRRDPRLRQATQAQQVRQVAGVTLVVLDPTVAPVVARGVREMHPEAGVLKQIHGPVPAVGRLDHHLRVTTRLAHHLEQRHRVVRDPDGVELLALSAHRVDHRAATMQVDTDVTSFHRASLVVRLV
jgi:hypothetical protein